MYLKVVLLYLLNLEQLDQTPVKNVRAFLIVCTLHYSFQEKQLQKKIETGFHTNTIISLSHEKQKDQKISCEQYEISSSW